jgi:hypothetical protein
MLIKILHFFIFFKAKIMIFDTKKEQDLKNPALIKNIIFLTNRKFMCDSTIHVQGTIHVATQQFTTHSVNLRGSSSIHDVWHQFM